MDFFSALFSFEQPLLSAFAWLVVVLAYLTGGLLAIVVEYMLEVPGLWGEFVRKQTGYGRRAIFVRTLVLLFWPVCLAILIIMLPFDFIKILVLLVTNVESGPPSAPVEAPGPASDPSLTVKVVKNPKRRSRRVIVQSNKARRW